MLLELLHKLFIRLEYFLQLEVRIVWDELDVIAVGNVFDSRRVNSHVELEEIVCIHRNNFFFTRLVFVIVYIDHYSCVLDGFFPLSDQQLGFLLKKKKSKREN